MPRDNLPDLVKAAALAVIAGLEMAADDPGFTVAGRVYSEIDQDDSNVTMPCWLLTSAGEKETLEGIDSEWFSRVLSFKALLRDTRGPGDHTKDSQYRSWRQEVITAFHQKRPVTDAVPACYWSVVEADAVYDPKQGGFQDVQGGVRLKFWLRVPRYPETLALVAEIGLVPAQGQG